MTDQQFAMFDTAIGACGVIWGERGITGVQLPMGSEEKTRNASTSATATSRKRAAAGRCSTRSSA
jgi:hypothetical protein